MPAITKGHLGSGGGVNPQQLQAMEQAPQTHPGAVGNMIGRLGSKIQQQQDPAYAANAMQKMREFSQGGHGIWGKMVGNIADKYQAQHPGMVPGQQAMPQISSLAQSTMPQAPPQSSRWSPQEGPGDLGGFTPEHMELFQQMLQMLHQHYTS